MQCLRSLFGQDLERLVVAEVGELGACHVKEQDYECEHLQDHDDFGVFKRSQHNGVDRVLSQNERYNGGCNYYAI